jgi:hypothetical protein
LTNQATKPYNTRQLKASREAGGYISKKGQLPVYVAALLNFQLKFDKKVLW